MKPSEKIKLIASGLSSERNNKGKIESAGRELFRIAGQVEGLERSAMLAALPGLDNEADALDGVGDFAREGQGGAEDAVADQVERMARANPDIARIVQAHTAGGRVDYAAALLELVQVLDRQNDALAQQIAEAAEADADLTAVWLAGAERGRDAVVATRARLDGLVEYWRGQVQALETASRDTLRGPRVALADQYAAMAKLASSHVADLQRALDRPQDGAVAAVEAARGGSLPAGSIPGPVLEKSAQTADLRAFRAISANGPATVAGQDGAVAVVEGQGSAQDA